MSRYVALLRAVNVGGTGKMPMADLVRLCEAAGFTNVRTLLASGNAIFDSGLTASETQTALAVHLETYSGKPVGVLLRTPEEMAKVLDRNPFAGCEPKLTHTIFLEAVPALDALDVASGVADEEMRLEGREIYVHYPSGSGRSKLRIPAAIGGTARNMNTVARIVAALKDD